MPHAARPVPDRWRSTQQTAHSAAVRAGLPAAAPSRKQRCPPDATGSQKRGPEGRCRAPRGWMRAQPAPARRHHQWQASHTARQRQRPSHRRTVHRVFRQTLATKSLTTKPLTSKPLTRMFHDLFHAVFHGMFHAMFPMPSSERSAWHHPWRDAPATPTTPWPIRSAQALRDAPDRVWPRHSPTGRSSTWPL